MFQQKGYLLESTKTVYWPEPMRYDYRYELEAGDVPPDVEFGVAAAPWPA